MIGGVAMALRGFLGLSALVWFAYGVFCFFRPEYLAQAAGVSAASLTATIELRAMYGGLQMAIGALAALALVRPALVRPALVAVGFLCGGLGLTRLLAVFAAGEVSAYTGFALIFEFTSAGLAAWLVRRERGMAPSPGGTR